MIVMVVKVVNNECKKVGEARKHTKYGNIKICNNTYAELYLFLLKRKFI